MSNALPTYRFSSRRDKGFTITELIIVIIVIAILAAIILVAYNAITRRAHETSLKSDLRNGATQLGVDKTNDGSYPNTLTGANGGKGLDYGDHTTFAYFTDGDAYCLSASSDIAGIPTFHIKSSTGYIEEGECPEAAGSWTVATLAGNSDASFVNGTGSVAKFNFYRPTNSSVDFGLDVDAEGNVYVADHGNNLVRKITPAGTVSTLAGMLGDNGEIITNQGTTSSFDYPLDVEVVSLEGLEALIVPTGSCLRFVAIYDAPNYGTDILNHVALGPHDGHIECGWGTNTSTVSVAGAMFRYPSSVVSDSDANLYVNESFEGKVRKVTAGTDWWDEVLVLSSAGGFADTTKFGIDPQDRIYASSGNKIVRFTSTGSRSDFVGASGSGNVDGSGSSARFNTPYGVDGDENGNIYVADCGNHSIRMITPSGEVTTIAGTGSDGHVDGPGDSARFHCPVDVAANATGSTVYVLDLIEDSDGVGGYVRKLTR